MLGAAHALLSSCGFTVDLTFVKGHQDTGVPTVLTRDAWLNVEADTLAKSIVSIPHTRPTHYKLPGNAWACYAGMQRVVKQFDNMLRTFINGKDTQTYWEKRKGLSTDTLQQVDWPSIGRAMPESAPDR